MAFVSANFSPDEKQLRQFGYIGLVAFSVLGAVIWWKEGLFGFDFGDLTPRVATVVWVLGAISGLFSAIWPSANRPLYLLMTLVAFPIGFVLSHAILLVFFYCVITPVGLVFRVMGRDPLERDWDSSKSSYWVDLPSQTDASRYFKQF